VADPVQTVHGMFGSPDDHRPAVALDWSFRGVHATFDGTSVEFFVSAEALLDDERLTVPHKIAAESTFESWDPQRRAAILDDIERRGHSMFMYRPLHTARARTAGGIDKSDSADAKVVWWLAHDPDFHLYLARGRDEEWASFAARTNQEYAKLRLSGKKPEMAAEAAKILGPLKSRDDESRLVLGASSGYCESLLAALYFVARQGCSRKEMERLLGLQGSAHPSLLRSDIHTHSYRHARKRLVATRPDVHDRRVVDRLRSSDQTPDAARVVKDWTVYRRQLRRAYHEIVAGINGAVADSGSAPETADHK
jgi:hypothetical protein